MEASVSHKEITIVVKTIISKQLKATKQLFVCYQDYSFTQRGLNKKTAGNNGQLSGIVIKTETFIVLCSFFIFIYSNSYSSIL